VTWKNWTEPVSSSDDFTFAAVIFMLFFDAAWYFALTIYIEGVFPGEFGIPLPWYFPLSPKYWCGYGASDADKDVHAPPPPASTGNTFERPPPDAVAGVSLVNLRKVFGDKVT
jgi:ATP-binding cassette subfamily A (ABC1) protein 3